MNTLDYIENVRENFNLDLIDMTYDDFNIMSNDFLIDQEIKEINKLINEGKI